MRREKSSSLVSDLLSKAFSAATLCLTQEKSDIFAVYLAVGQKNQCSLNKNLLILQP